MLLLVWPAIVQGQHYSFRSFGREHGLTNLEVLTIVQDPKGFLWAGTQNGAFRYDGSSFLRFGLKEGLPSTPVETLHVSGDGAIWAGTRNGLARWDGEQFRPAQLPVPYLMYGRDTIATAGGPAGKRLVYFSTDRGLAIGTDSGSGWVFQRPVFANANANLPSIGVEVDSRGRVWYGCGKLLCVLEDGVVRDFGAGVGLPFERWHWVHIDGKQNLWVRSETRLFVRPAGANRFEDAGAGLGRSTYGPAPIFDQRGRLLVPTLDGLAIGTLAAARPTNIRWDFVKDDHGLNSAHVSSVQIDREGLVWMGLAGGGLVRWLGGQSWRAWGQREGLHSESVFSPVYDKQGNLWVGTPRGLHRMSGNRFEQWPKLPIPPIEMLQISVGHDGMLWAATWSAGLYCVNPVSGEYRKYGEREGLPGDFIIRAVEDDEGNLWVAARTGLYQGRRENGQWRFQLADAPAPPGGKAMYMPIVDRSGRVWVGGPRGLLVRDAGRWHLFTARDGIPGAPYVLLDAGDGSIYLSAAGTMTLSRARYRNGRIAVEQLAQSSLPDAGAISQLGLDALGQLWIGTDEGVFARTKMGWRHATRLNGLAWDETNGGSFLASEDGSVWIGTSRGLSRYEPLDALAESVAPVAAFSMVRVGAGERPIVSGAKLPFEDRSLNVRFAATSYADESSMLFRYRWAPGEWVETKDTAINIPILSPGHYALELMARNAAGVWSAEVARFEFEVEPPWYRNPVFTGLMALLCGVAVAVWWWRRERRVRMREDELGMLIAQRTRELAESRDRAEESNRLKSQFLATMSHEIRTPLNGVLGLTRLVLGSELAGEQREHLELARQSGESLLALLNDILDLSRIEAGRLDLVRETFALREILSAALAALHLEARRKGLKLSIAVDADVPDCLVGDAMRLRQVILNLVGNALKFTAEGGVALTVEAAGGQGLEQMLRFSVRDTGIGIGAEQQEAIFDAFRQADSSSTRQHGGSGLGLSISRRLVEMMGGELGVTSQFGEGSTFWFTTKVEVASAPPEKCIPRPVPPTASRGNGIHVLVVEDNPVNQRVTQRLLQQAGCGVSVCGNGLVALDMMSEGTFDIVLMDVHMPEMDGLTATQTWRKREAGKAKPLPILAMTACAMEGDRERCLQSGMDDYLAKPLIPEELIAKVLALTGRAAHSAHAR
ncbi:MAG: ATP-binding protein [Acidobacteriota bacterium]